MTHVFKTCAHGDRKEIGGSEMKHKEDAIIRS